MDTKEILTFGLIIFGLFGMSGMASAAVSLTDGNDDVIFVGETLTLSNWENCSTSDNNYLWVIDSATKKAYIGQNASDVLQSGYDIGFQKCTYTINTTKNITEQGGSTGTYHIYVRATNTGSSPTINASTISRDIAFQMNNFSVAITPDLTNYGVFGGDNATLTITTSGPAADLELTTFTLGLTESGATSTKTAATAGVITYKIGVTSTANDQQNVTVSNGYASRSASYAVRALDVTAIDRAGNTNATNGIAIKALDEAGALANVSSDLVMVFGITISGKADDLFGQVAGNYSVNVTFVNNSQGAVVTDSLYAGAAGTATVTASCRNFTLSDSTTYTVEAAGTNLTITGTSLNGTSTTAFMADQVVTIAGWTRDASTEVWVNISNATSQVALLEVNSSALNNTWLVNWNTSDYTLPNQGTYTIFAWENNSVQENATAYINITTALAITSANSSRNATTTLVNQVYVDDVLVINGTSARSDGKPLTVNITRGTYSYLANVTVYGNGKFGATWTAESTTAAGVGAFQVIVKDGGLATATQTITVLDNLAVVSPSVGPKDSTVAIKGTSSRANGTTIYLNATKDGFQVMSLPATATVAGWNWTYSWSTAGLPDGVYTIIATDTLTTATYQITLGTGTITSMATSASEIFLDDTVNITATTTFPVGTSVSVNITNCSGSGGVILETTTTVAADQSILYAFTPTGSLATVITEAGLAAGTPATLCVSFQVSTTSASTTFDIKDDLALTTVASVVAGDQVLLTGTSSRANSTNISVNVTYGGLYNIFRNATVTGQSANPLTTSTGTFANTTYFATKTDGNNGSEALGAGTYTITATDGVVTATKTLTVGTTGTIEITQPTEAQSITGGPIAVEGTSNRANGTGVAISIAGRNTSTLSTIVNTSGMFNATWNTDGFLSGVYYITVSQAAGLETDVISITFTSTSSTTSSSVTTTTGDGTTTTGESTTTTTSGTQCTMAGNSDPCGAVTLTEVVAAINLWSVGEMTLGDVVDLINSWAEPLEYPAN